MVSSPSKQHIIEIEIAIKKKKFELEQERLNKQQEMLDLELASKLARI